MALERRLRIGQFISHYPYARDTADYFSGGTGTVAQGLSRALAANGHDTHVVAVGAGKRSSTEWDREVAVHRYGALFRVAQANLSTSILHAPLAHHFDIVHVHAGNPPAPLAGYLYARRRGVPLIVTYHGDPQASYGSVARRTGVLMWIAALRQVVCAADRIICPSGAFVPSSRYLQPYAGRVIEVPNGFDPEESAWCETPEAARARLGLPPDAKVILFLGAFSPYKAPDLVVAAARKALHRDPKVWLVMAGSGTMEDEIRRAAATSGVADRIKFLGFVTGDAKRRAYRAASLFVLPSVMTTEVFPMVLLEASAFGLPLVVSDLPTFRSIVAPGDNGLVVPRGDVEQLADALDRLADDPLAQARMGRQARERLKDYTWARIAARHEAIYRDALAPAGQKLSVT